MEQKFYIKNKHFLRQTLSNESKESYKLLSSIIYHATKKKTNKLEILDTSIDDDVELDILVKDEIGNLYDIELLLSSAKYSHRTLLFYYFNSLVVKEVNDINYTKKSFYQIILVDDDLKYDDLIHTFGFISDDGSELMDEDEKVEIEMICIPNINKYKGKFDLFHEFLYLIENNKIYDVENASDEILYLVNKYKDVMDDKIVLQSKKELSALKFVESELDAIYEKNKQ